ncbi:HNH endonuclease [Dolichospermum sp. ST_con]|nr:HNH endonuclease [Dolichospermum sp. ST_con]
MSDRVTESIRRAVAARSCGYCEYCRCSEKFATQSFTVEHIKPRKEGGENGLENLAWSCFGCNAHKHTKTEAIDSETQEKIALFNPRQQAWSDNFNWNNDFTQVIGKTPSGRVTVESLRLNRVGVVNLRRLLFAANLHPPEKVGLSDLDSI